METEISFVKQISIRVEKRTWRIAEIHVKIVHHLYFISTISFLFVELYI